MKTLKQLLFPSPRPATSAKLIELEDAEMVTIAGGTLSSLSGATVTGSYIDTTSYYLQPTDPCLPLDPCRSSSSLFV